MVSNENNEEMSVNDILSSIKEVISSEQDLKKSSNDDNFIELARSVYITNDKRARIKRNINKTFSSELIEEKSYSDY